MENELEQTRKWEIDWKIHTNIQKCTIHYSRTSKTTLEKYGGIKSNNTNIPIMEETKILGSHQKYNTKGNTQAKIITKRAGISQNKLYRFSNAPIKVKKILFKALTRAVLEYPCTTLSNINKYHTKQMQKIQNRGLRFIKNICEAFEW